MMLEWILTTMITSMMFFPEKQFYEKPVDYGLVHEDVSYTTSDGVKLFGWYLPARQEKGTVLYFHGNAGNISGRIYKAQGWVERGFSVFLVDYRGYGKSEGTIRHQEDLITDAEASLEWLQKNKKLALSKTVFYGESLGSHPAIRMAAKYKAAALVLEAPYTSFIALKKIHYPWVPAGLIKDFSFPNAEHVEHIQTPVFILHGTRDDVCPYAMSEELFTRAPSPKEFFTIEGGSHSDLPAKVGKDYWEKPVSFVSKYIGETEKN